jgi:TolC family type I secretion outer membrane protein
MVFFWLPATAEAAEPSTAAVPVNGAGLRLEDAVRIALENHPRIKAAEEDIGAQRAVLGQSLAAYYPVITFDNFYRTSLSSGSTTTAQEAFDFFSSRANLGMTLYDFGKREGTVQSARDTLEASRYTLKTAADEVVVAVKEAYYTYLAAVALVQVEEDTVKDRELLVRQAQGFYEVGTKPKIDVARAESNLFSARANFITAQNGVKIAWATLKNAMGVEDLSDRPSTEKLSFVPPPMTLGEAKETAFASRPELKDLEAQRKAEDQNIAAARRGHLPDVLFDANYGRRNTSRGGNTFPLQEDWTVQLSFNIPIFDGFRTTHRVQESLHNYNSIKAQEEEKKQLVALEVESNYLKVVEAEERIKATEAAAKAAKENLELANGRYQVGVGSIIEITEAQVLDTVARTNHIRALLDFKIAEAQLLKAMGR